ncbi:MAG: hypothetical protein ACLFQU_11620 [Candidatus Kapaibacterium sp.]
MAGSIKKYIYSPKEIELFRKEKKLLESKRGDITNYTLIKARKYQLDNIRGNVSYRQKRDEFNKRVNSLQPGRIADIITMFLKQSN